MFLTDLEDQFSSYHYHCGVEFFVISFIISQYLVQAIRDGVIEATIDHENKYVQSKETTDIYGTREPSTQFHQRIKFCLDIHNQSVKVSESAQKNVNNFWSKI